jgi:hypothetical protein
MNFFSKIYEIPRACAARGTMRQFSTAQLDSTSFKSGA